MKDYHTKPSNKVRSVEDALKDAERLRNELPRIVQVFARDWDKVILADRIAELEKDREDARTMYDDYNKSIAELEFEVEQLKCCGNCKHEPEFFSDNGCCVMCVKLDKWGRND